LNLAIKRELFTYEQNRQLPHVCQIHGFMNAPLGCRAIAEKNNGNCLSMCYPELPELPDPFQQLTKLSDLITKKLNK